MADGDAVCAYVGGVVSSGRVAAGGILPEAALAVARLLAAAVGEVDPQRPDRAGEWLGLVPHVMALLGVRGRLPGGGEEALAECAADLSIALQWAGSYPAALEVAQAGLQRGGGLAADHRAVLSLRVFRAGAQRNLGRYADAEAEFRQVLEAQLRILGPDHPSTRMTQGALMRLPPVPQ